MQKMVPAENRVSREKKSGQREHAHCIQKSPGWGMFFCNTLGPLTTITHRLNATVYLSYVASHVHPIMATIYPFSTLYLKIMHTITEQNSFQTGFMSMTMRLRFWLSGS